MKLIMYPQEYRIKVVSRPVFHRPGYLIPVASKTKLVRPRMNHNTMRWNNWRHRRLVNNALPRRGY